MGAVHHTIQHGQHKMPETRSGPCDCPWSSMGMCECAVLVHTHTVCTSTARIEYAVAKSAMRMTVQALVPTWTSEVSGADWGQSQKELCAKHTRHQDPDTHEQVRHSAVSTSNTNTIDQLGDGIHDDPAIDCCASSH